MKRRVLVFTLIGLLMMSAKANASEFRSFRPIRTPAVSQPAPGEPGDVQATLKPVSREVLRAAAAKLVAAWNGNQLDRVVGKEFFDKSRLLDAMSTSVPRDAQLKVLAIQNARTINQQVKDSASGKLLVSVVSLTLRTQIEFNDAINGFQRREGTNEFILRVKQLYSGN